MIEILVVVGIIALLVGMLIPAATTVRKMAKEVKQKAQFTAIDLGLAAFKNDYGDYPPSLWWIPPTTSARRDYCGAQKLAEAMVGWDLLGFHPNSGWRADGLDASGGTASYDPARSRGDEDGDGVADTLNERRDRYIDLQMANAFRLGQSAAGDGLFADTGTLAPNTYVLCDVFEVPQRKIVLPDPTDLTGPGTRVVTPGTPILYYRANPASKMHDPTGGSGLDGTNLCIYDARDNAPLANLHRLADGRVHPLEADVLASGFTYFYRYIRDPRVQSPWPRRPDSYILISAGYDGLYGTDDDICNFTR